MKILTHDDLAIVLTDLRQYFPRSIQMHSMIRNHLTGLGWPGTEFVCDQFPDYSCILFRRIPGSKEYVLFPRSNTVAVFCKDVSKLRSFLDTDQPVDFSQPTSFFGVSRNDVYPVLLQYCQTVGTVEAQDPPDLGNVILLNPEKLNKRELPEGFRLGELSLEHAEQVNREWRYGGEETLPFMQRVIKCFPTTAVFTTDDRLVAYILLLPDGCMGNGYVNPEFRRRNLYQVVNYHQAKKVLEMGQKRAWVYVMMWNEASRNSYLKLGGEVVPEDVFCVDWIHYHPKGYVYKNGDAVADSLH